MSNNRLFLAAVSLALAAYFFGCSTDTVAPQVEVSNKASKEFQFNYSFLYYYYYKSADELEDSEAYLESPLKAIINEKYADVADVIVMYESMSDPLTTYYPHAFYSAVSSAIRESDTEDKSFGMELDGELRVKTVFRVGPAASAGVLKGDVVLALDSVPLNGSDSLYEAILSAKKDAFTFSIARSNDTLSMEMTRTAVIAPTVFLDSAENIPVIRVTEFVGKTNGFDSDGTALEFEDALERTKGAASTILDLRGNGGGSVNLCERMAKAVLRRGDTVIVERQWGYGKKGRDSSEQVVTAEKDGIGAGRYYVMMLDSGSASCTEIFAAALTANLKVPVVGTNSFGKGIGQTYVTTPDSAFGVATSILFLDKDFQSYHRYGFEPDFTIADSDSAFQKAIELASGMTFQRTAGYGSEVQPYWDSAKRKQQKTFSPKEALRELKRGMAIREFSGF